MKRNITKIINDLMAGTLNGSIVWLEETKGDSQRFSQLKGRYEVLSTISDNSEESTDRYYLKDTRTKETLARFVRYINIDSRVKKNSGPQAVEALFRKIEALPRYQAEVASATMPSFQIGNTPITGNKKKR